MEDVHQVRQQAALWESYDVLSELFAKQRDLLKAEKCCKVAVFNEAGCSDKDGLPTTGCRCVLLTGQRAACGRAGVAPASILCR